MNIVNIMDIMDFVDFSSFEQVDESIPQYKKDGRPITYNTQTTVYYKVMRMRQLDPITSCTVDSDSGFSFPHEWDPYTGQRSKLDPFGPLWFEPNSLIYAIYVKRLNMLYKIPEDGGYEGYYDNGVGSGEDMFVISRGASTHMHPFRLPIIDCYLTDSHNLSVITMGAKLTDEECEQIDKLAEKKPNLYSTMFKKVRPSLLVMKKLYDQAISKAPIIAEYKDNVETFKELPKDKKKELRYKANINAVDELRKL